MAKKKEYWTSPSGVTYEVGAPWPPENVEKKLGYIWVPNPKGSEDDSKIDDTGDDQNNYYA